MTALRRFARRLGVLLASTLVCLLLVEAGVRLGWANQPDAVFPNDTGCCGGPTLRPNVSGHDVFHRFHHNSLGYRGPEYAARKPGPLRVAIVGDSFVYGVAVSADDAIPGVLGTRLDDRLPGAEVINAGMPGNNLEYNVARVRRVVHDYHPDVVVMVTLYNDFEVAKWQQDLTGQVNRVVPTPTGVQNRMGALAQWMLPTVEPGDRRFGPGGTPPASITTRYAVARWWKTYQYVGLEFRKVGTDWLDTHASLSLLHVDSEQVDALAWGRLGAAMAELRAQGERDGFRFGVAHFMDGPLAGIPAQKLRAAVVGSGVPLLDLAPLWGTLENYNRNFSFRFDNHPNRRANAMVAEALEHWMGSLGWLAAPASEGDAAFVAAHQARVEAYAAAQADRASAQRAELSALFDGFTPSLQGDERNDHVKRRQRPQWLVGWIDALAGERADGKMFATEAGFFLRAAEPAAFLRVEGYRIDPNGWPLRVACSGEEAGPPQVPASATFALDFPLTTPVAAGERVECVVATVGRRSPDPNRQSAAYAMTRLALAPPVASTNAPAP